MEQTINFAETSFITFNGQNVKSLILNNNKIWVSNDEEIPESQGTPGLIYTGMDASGHLETSADFDGTITQYMLGTTIASGSIGICKAIDTIIFDTTISEIKIPSFHNNLPVTRIGGSALGGINFSGDTGVTMPNLNKITVGANIQIIYDRGIVNYSNTTASTVYIPTTVTELNIKTSATIAGNKVTIEFNAISCSIYDYDKNPGIGVDTVIVKEKATKFACSYACMKTLIFSETGDDITYIYCANNPILTSLSLSNRVKIISALAFYKNSGLTTITIPSVVYNIGRLAFQDTNALTTMRFEQPSGMAVTLPTAGSTDGMLYSKTARNMTIYTDNETIRNYAYSSDNITATILHIDGSAWV